MYNREYLDDKNTNNNEKKSSYEEAQSVPADTVGFLKATYQLFASSLLAAAAGAYVGLGMVETLTAWKWGIFALFIGLIFVVHAVKHKPGINLAALFAFTFVSGLVITPLLSVAFGMSGGAGIVGQAFLMTSVAFGGISMFALTTKRDFSGMGKMLMIALIILIVGSISNIFIQSSIMQLGIAMVGALVFSAFILYDTQKIIQGGFETPIEASIALYLDFLNLFTSLLQILMAFGGKDD
jgi:modulator of FtsH protease